MVVLWTYQLKQAVSRTKTQQNLPHVIGTSLTHSSTSSDGACLGRPQQPRGCSHSPSAIREVPGVTRMLHMASRPAALPDAKEPPRHDKVINYDLEKLILFDTQIRTSKAIVGRSICILNNQTSPAIAIVNNCPKYNFD